VVYTTATEREVDICNIYTYKGIKQKESIDI
jgi:hypothetical protein